MKKSFHELAGIRDWYARHESNTGGAFMISPRDAKKYNEQQHAIAWTVNFFEKMPRQKIFLKEIISYAIDLDDGTKADQVKIINSGLMPSLINETKNGYHVYWNVDGAPVDADMYRAFIEDRMLDKYGADQQAMDACRILRVPNFLHQKDIKDPFLVKTVYSSDAVYTYEQLEEYFPVNKKRLIVREQVKHMQSEYPEIKTSGGDVYGLFAMDQKEALKRISGDPLIGGTSISFKPESGGRYRIFFDGERKNKWIDENGKIGSMNGYGPTVWQFLRALGVNKEDSITVLKKHFKECFTNEL